MSLACPSCRKDEKLWENVDVEGTGWRYRGEKNGPPHPPEDIEWDFVDPNGEVGCGLCDWRGLEEELVNLGIDGEPLPFVHPAQLVIEAA